MFLAKMGRVPRCVVELSCGQVWLRCWKEHRRDPQSEVGGEIPFQKLADHSLMAVFPVGIYLFGT